MNAVQIFEIVKVAFWQGHFFAVMQILRTRAGTSHIDATSRKDFLRRYCKDTTRRVVPNDIDTKKRFQNQKGPAAMDGLSPLNFTCFRITLQANALRVMCVCGCACVFVIVCM